MLFKASFSISKTRVYANFEVWLLFSDSTQSTTLVHYTYKRFMKLTTDVLS